MKHSPRQKAVRYQVGGYAFTTKGISRFDLRDPYHVAVTLTWPQFLLTLLGVYLSVNLLFAALYTAGAGQRGERRARATFADAFFFSFETLATVGYGEMYPGNLLRPYRRLRRNHLRRCLHRHLDGPHLRPVLAAEVQIRDCR